MVETICDILGELKPLNKNEKSSDRYSQEKLNSYRDLIRFVVDRPSHDKRYAIDATKQTELGWKAQESFDTGIRKTVQWYLDNKWWWKPLLDERYKGERLGKL